MESGVNPEQGERVLGLVKDGTVYEAFRSASGQLVVVDTRKDRLPVSIDEVGGVCVARVDCGENCYIFDRGIFRSAVREVLELARKVKSDLVLDLSRVSLVSGAHLNALRHLHDHLDGRGRRLIVVSGSSVVARDVAGSVPGLDGRVFSREGDAIACASGAGVAGAC